MAKAVRSPEGKERQKVKAVVAYMKQGD